MVQKVRLQLWDQYQENISKLAYPVKEVSYSTVKFLILIILQPKI